MGGSILVGNGVALSSRDFDYIIEKIRPYFPATEHLFRDEIYDPVDKGGMSFLNLHEQNEEGVKAFLHATTAAFEHEFNMEDRSREAIWNELLDAIKSDFRIRDEKKT